MGMGMGDLGGLAWRGWTWRTRLLGLTNKGFLVWHQYQEVAGGIATSWYRCNTRSPHLSDLAVSSAMPMGMEEVHQRIPRRQGSNEFPRRCVNVPHKNS